MTIINLSDGNSVLNQFIAEIRDKDVQKNHMRFRRNLERIGEIFAYEISKTLNYSIKDVTTPLGIAQCSVPGELTYYGDISKEDLIALAETVDYSHE